MLHQMKWAGAALALAAAGFFGTPDISFAQRGGHGGGGHASGGHVGGGYGGGYRGGYGGGYGGYYGGRGFGYGLGFGLGYGLYGGYGYGGYGLGYGYGGYPYYGYSSYYPYYSSGYVAPAYDYSSYPYSGYSSTAPATPMPSGTYSLAVPSADVAVTKPVVNRAVANIEVVLPASAKVWFNGALTTTTGEVREYQTPALTPGQEYLYQIRASWQQNGQEMSQTQTVTLTAGRPVHVVFPMTAASPAESTIAH